MIVKSDSKKISRKSRKPKTKIVSMVQMSQMIERFKEFQSENNLKQNQIAAALGFSDSYISEILNFKKEITIDFLVGLKKAWPHLSCDYILFGIKKPPLPRLKLADFVNVTERGLNPENFVTVPLVSGRIAATIGSGVIVDEHVEDWAVVHEKVTGRKKNLIAIRVDKKDGDSMKPILGPGDVVIIDREDKIEINPRAIYAVQIEDGCTVKRLKQSGSRLFLISENREPPYDEITDIDLELNPQPVIGRVIWYSKGL
jgi:SOS-response transcriptional repressor LexA